MTTRTIEIDAQLSGKTQKMLDRIKGLGDLSSSPSPSELDQMVSEYGLMLTRAKETKETLKGIETAATVKLNCSVTAFKTYATAVWKDKVDLVKGDLQEKLSLFGEDE